MDEPRGEQPQCGAEHRRHAGQQGEPDVFQANERAEENDVGLAEAEHDAVPRAIPRAETEVAAGDRLVLRNVG